MTATIPQIAFFCKAVAQCVTIPEVAEQLCGGAKINPHQTGFISCPSPHHQERHITHCSYTGSGSQDCHKFHCFACGASGDAVTYAALWLGLSNFAAARKINEYFHLNIPDPCDPKKY